MEGKEKLFDDGGKSLVMSDFARVMEGNVWMQLVT